MSEPNETVADVLYELGDDEVEPLYTYVHTGQTRPEDLSYEDWVRPLKLTGGRVCLRIDYPRSETVHFVRRSKTGHLERWSSETDGLLEVGLVWFRGAMVRADAVITPVLREDTPFAEAETGEA